jgi:hypothetical protein
MGTPTAQSSGVPSLLCQWRGSTPFSLSSVKSQEATTLPQWVICSCPVVSGAENTSQWLKVTTQVGGMGREIPPQTYFWKRRKNSASGPTNHIQHVIDPKTFPLPHVSISHIMVNVSSWLNCQHFSFLK